MSEDEKIEICKKGWEFLDKRLPELIEGADLSTQLGLGVVVTLMMEFHLKNKNKMKQLSKEQLESQIETFNRAYKVGDKVEVYRILGEKETFVDEIKHEATIMGGHTAMTWLKDKGSYDLSFVKGAAKDEVEK